MVENVYFQEEDIVMEESELDDQWFHAELLREHAAICVDRVVLKSVLKTQSWQRIQKHFTTFGACENELKILGAVFGCNV